MRTPTLTRKIAIALAGTIGLLLLLGGGATYVAITQAHSARNAAQVTAQLRHLAEAGSALRDVQRGERGYVLTGEAHHLAPYYAAQRSFSRNIDTLRTLAAPAEKGRFTELEAEADVLIAMLDSTIALRRDQGLTEELLIAQEGRIKPRTDALLARLDGLQRAVNHEFNVVSRRAEDRASDMVVLILLTALASVLAIGTAGRRLLRTIDAHLRSERGLAESEARFDTAFAAAPTALVISRVADGSIRGVNDAFLCLTGHTRASALGRRLTDVGLPVEALRPARTEGDAPTTRELRVERVDGTTRHVLTATAVVAFGGDPCLLSLLHDITERKQAEEALARTNVTLAHRNRELQDFAYVASHDLQEPLRKIRAFANILHTEHGSSLDDDSRFYVERIGAAAARMSNLLAALLEYSRVATDPRPFDRVDLARACRDVVASLASDILARRAVVEIDAPVTLEADPYQLRQLLRHLLHNALTFRHVDAAPQIRLRAQIIEHAALPGAPRPACQIEVVDDGIGFDERYLEKMFAPFQRLHGREQYPGSGMGLAVVRRIAERHHGTVTARSAPGQGSTFIVTLPLCQASAPATTAAVPHPLEAAGA